MRSQLLPLTCAIFDIFFTIVSASCYYPDGSFPKDSVYVPCSGSGTTSCCIMSEGDQCLSNGLCWYPSGQYMFRGACTDQNWNSPNCFNHCTNKTNSYADSYDRIVKCGGDRHCCSSDGSTCCNDDSKVFTLGNLSVIKDLVTTSRRTGGFQAAAPTQTATSSSLGSASTGSAITGTLPTNTAANATPASTAANAPIDTKPGASTFSKTAIIAASVGATLVFVILVALIWFFIRRYYRKKLKSGVKEQSYPFQKLPDKSPRPVEVPAPLHSPLPLYQPPAYKSPMQGAVEMDNSYRVPQRNQWGQEVFEAPGHMHGRG